MSEVKVMVQVRSALGPAALAAVAGATSSAAARGTANSRCRRRKCSGRNMVPPLGGDGHDAWSAGSRLMDSADDALLTIRFGRHSGTRGNPTPNVLRRSLTVNQPYGASPTLIGQASTRAWDRRG